MSADGFARMLNDAMGLNAHSIGPYAIARAVQERMSALGVADDEGYSVIAAGSPEELQALVEAVVVPETWFFRNPPAFAELVREAVALALVRDGGVLRVLSVPCSSGEEPYSMAMALLDTGFLPQSFHIDGFDISSRTLALAREATYGENSFRGEGLEFRERHFEATDLGYRVSEPARDAVRFAQGNVLAPDFLSGAEPYDVIFCRNLLVYLDVEAQDRAIATVRRLLVSGGVLCVGPGEAGLMLRHGFSWSKVPLAFSFRKDAAPVEKAAPPSRFVERAEAASAIARKRVELPDVKPSAAPPETLEHAVRLADLGQLREAADVCDGLIGKNGPSSPVFHLRALICSAGGDTIEAAAYFRKALYLEPNSGESLVHLALLLEHGGDPAAALLLRERLQRLPAPSAEP